jgi:periplasmic divalent cation tolerance protein
MIVDVYITAKNQKEARKIAKILVKERLVACVNIIPRIESVYWWQNKMQHHGESALIAKTKKSNVRKIVSRIKSIHSYSVPCIVSLPIKDGNKDFMNWVKKETID